MASRDDNQPGWRPVPRGYHSDDETISKRKNVRLPEAPARVREGVFVSERQVPSPPPRHARRSRRQVPSPPRKLSTSPPTPRRVVDQDSGREILVHPIPAHSRDSSPWRGQGHRHSSPVAVPRRGSFSYERQRPDPPFVAPPVYLVPPNDDDRYYSADDAGTPRAPKWKVQEGRRQELKGPVITNLDRHSDARVVLPEDSSSQNPRRASTGGRFGTTYRPNFEAASSRPSLAHSGSSGTLGDKVFRYTELREYEFRLVELLPARMHGVKCKVHHTSLRNPPSYVAVSYAWGDAGDTTTLKLDDVTIPVAVSLHGALEALRRRKESVMVWIDALCIDQQNRTERTQQVQLMTDIYSNADSVALWLGPEADDSDIAADVLKRVADKSDSPGELLAFLEHKLSRRALGTVVSLFEREYWRRLWVVQEVFHARTITVYCGTSVMPWSDLKKASRAFGVHRADLNYLFPPFKKQKAGTQVSTNHFSLTQVLVYQGPASLPDITTIRGLGDASLLEVMRACRRKLSADPRDKVFGILGVLPQAIRDSFPVDYSLSVKDVYTDVVDYLLHNTERLDVICESIHFPLHGGSAGLPSWVPDWSHIPETTPIGLSGRFAAAGPYPADFKFVDKRRNKLKISAIEVGRVRAHGVSVGTLCTLGDYLMAFLNWRALLLDDLEDIDKEDTRHSLFIQNLFCRTLCLDQVPDRWNKGRDWLAATYHVFASLTRERLPHLKLDRKLRSYINMEDDVGVNHEDRRRFLQEHFGKRMMGRCFCITEDGVMGMGCGFMTVGDVIVVPLGCSTPIILRPEGSRGEYRFVGDVYLDGYMYGHAVLSDREAKHYVLH